MQNSHGFVIFDFRESNEFNKSKINHSINIPLKILNDKKELKKIFEWIQNNISQYIKYFMYFYVLQIKIFHNSLI